MRNTSNFFSVNPIAGTFVNRSGYIQIYTLWIYTDAYSGEITCAMVLNREKYILRKELEMAEFNRKAGVLWAGDLKTGRGLISTESQTLFELPFSHSTRFGDDVGINPEELIAAAHASCFSMMVVSTLEKNGFTPVQTEVTATCTLASKDAGGHEINNMRLHVRCEVPDIDEARFNELVMEADSGCPVSNLLRNGADIEITTALIQTHGA